ncbi:MAG TPA: polysaccharide biosynthesis protein [Clostridiales bacterium]|nr:polysaccharide biosynthesis protein [Clostridiales bacterium]
MDRLGDSDNCTYAREEARPPVIALARPDIGELEIQLVNRVLRSDFLSMGEMTPEFERALADYVGAPHAIAVSSGTAGLHCLVRALGIGPGDEVVTTSFSFVASSNVLLYEGARPVFADIEPEQLCLDPDLVEAAITPRTRSILAVDVFGHPCRLDRLKAIADDCGIPLIDDACEALGAELNGVKIGAPGQADAAVFAFFPNKQITTGEGGMVVTGDGRIAAMCRSLRNQGRGEGDQWLVHERLGYNYRLDELGAALGVGQLARIEELLERRDRVADLYRQRLTRVHGVKTYPVAPGVRMSWFVYVVRLDAAIDRDRVARQLAGQGIPTRPYFQPIHLQPFYRERFGYRGGELPVTEAAGRSCLALPFHGRLTAEEVETVAAALEEAIVACSG